MSEVLKVAPLQMDIQWEQKEGNRAKVARMLSELPDGIDLVVLPEMFTTGFSMQPQGLAEGMNGETIQWLNSLTKDANYAICGSFIASEGADYFNRFVWSEKGSIRYHYDKRHLFTMAGEHKVYSPGKGSPVIEYRGWRILPRICYDLRFPVWCRTTDVDLHIYVANWPKPRVNAWDTLLKARAIENQCYVVGVNRVGIDGNANEYVGHSAAIDSKGVLITKEHSEAEGWIVARLEKAPLLEFRDKFPIYLDADAFEIKD
jgi:predicted amidohydrolase